MSLMEWFERTTLANVTAVALVIVGLGYAVYTQNSELVAFLVGAGVTWLFDQKNSSNG